MPRIPLVENERISVWVDPELALIHHQMHQPCYGEALREALRAGLEAMQEHGATKWLSDDRHNGALPPEDEAWAGEVWFPSVLEAGWTHWALVRPKQVVGQLNTQRFVQGAASQGIAVKVFSDPDQALAWLRSV